MDTNRYNLIPDDLRLFHQEGQQLDVIREVSGIVHKEDTSISFSLESLNKEKYFLHVFGYNNDVFRIQFGKEKQIDNTTLIELDKDVINSAIQIQEEKETTFIKNGDAVLKIDKNLFQVCLLNKKNEVVWELENTDKKSWCVTPCLGYAGNPNTMHPVISFRIQNDEQLYGLGEKFNRVNKVQSRATIWGTDTMGTNTTDLSYKSIPVLFSTKGWGMMMYSTYCSHWEIGSFSYPTASVMVEDQFLDFFLFQGENLKKTTEKYYQLTAKPQQIPKWALGVWMSKCSYNTKEDILDVMGKIEERQMPVDSINIDTGWLKEGFYHTIGTDCCDFEWDDSRLADRKELLQEMKERGFHISIWMNPYLAEHVSLYKEAEMNNYLVKDIRGGNARIESCEPAGLVDFTNPEAVEWWKRKVRVFLEDGISCIKPDYADRTPITALFYNGKTGREMHNIYSHLYIKAVDEVTYEVHKEHILFRRAGYIGTNKYPVTWAGDTQTSWQALQCVLHAGISAGLSGDALWSHDIGGFTGPKPNDELYIRWVQFGMLSPVSRFHGTTPREPWTFTKETEQTVIDMMRLRYTLLPYLYECCKESHRIGTPMMRHLLLEFPEDPCAPFIEDQYMLGENLLIAPIILQGKRKRNVYLPEGKWFSYFSDSLLSGGKYQQADAPLTQIPVFVRDGSIVLMNDHDILRAEEKVDSYSCLIVAYDQDAALNIQEDDCYIHIDVRHEDSIIVCECEHNLAHLQLDIVMPEDKELVQQSISNTATSTSTLRHSHTCVR